MTTNAPARDALLAEFDQAWRDGSPVFGCCRRAMGVALDGLDPLEMLALDATARVSALREKVESEMPGHLDAHRCCVGHLADVAFDLPDALSPAVDAQV